VTHILAAAHAAPTAGAIACLAAVAAMCLLDRIPLSAFRPRTDDGRTPRRRQRPRVQVQVEEVWDESPPTTVRRLDQPAITRPARPRRELEGR
jgi:hypothetical protein